MDADVEPRSFLVDAQTGLTQTQSTVLRTVRTCNLQFAAGIESPVPQLPTIPANALPIATVTMSPTGITSIAIQSSSQRAHREAHALAHRFDESPAGYSLVGRPPAQPASASPTVHEYAVQSVSQS